MSVIGKKKRQEVLDALKSGDPSKLRKKKREKEPAPPPVEKSSPPEKEPTLKRSIARVFDRAELMVEGIMKDDSDEHCIDLVKGIVRGIASKSKRREAAEGFRNSPKGIDPNLIPDSTLWWLTDNDLNEIIKQCRSVLISKGKNDEEVVDILSKADIRSPHSIRERIKKLLAEGKIPENPNK
jgi:hypothetical protein